MAGGRVGCVCMVWLGGLGCTALPCGSRRSVVVVWGQSGPRLPGCRRWRAHPASILETWQLLGMQEQCRQAAAGSHQPSQAAGHRSPYGLRNASPLCASANTNKMASMTTEESSLRAPRAPTKSSPTPSPGAIHTCEGRGRVGCAWVRMGECGSRGICEVGGSRPPPTAAVGRPGRPAEGARRNGREALRIAKELPSPRTGRRPAWPGAWRRPPAGCTTPGPPPCRVGSPRKSAPTPPLGEPRTWPTKRPFVRPVRRRPHPPRRGRSALRAPAAPCLPRRGCAD